MTNAASDDAAAPRFSKRTLFLMILGAAAGIAGVISLIAYTVVDRTSDQDVKLAVIVPLSGPHQALGEAIRRGAEQHVIQLNKAGGSHGRQVKLLVLDDGDDPAKARQAATKAADENVIGVIGHWSEAAALAAGEVYRERGLPAITPAAPFDADVPANPWLFWDSFDQMLEVRFLANYVRNVLGEKTVSIIHPAGDEGGKLAQTFDEVLQRFGTKVLTRWDYDPVAETAPQRERMAAIAAEAKDKKLIGVILVLGDPRASAHAVAALRKAEVRNRVVGPRVLASGAFAKALAESWQGPGSVGSGLNEILTTTPLLFDTAGELAQGFRNGYTKQHRSAPDWLAASAFDAARILIHSLGRPPRDGKTAATDTSAAQRLRLRDRLARLNGHNDRFDGVLGPVAFDGHWVSAPMVLVGSYAGADLVAALTQLSPIREENVGNQLEELVAGRALYVNDRFMYKTNVVYAGLRLDKVTGLDPSSRTVTLDFTLWFRWRGPIEPQDIVFTNAVEPIRLDKPEREARNGDMTYRAYRARGKFFLNYSRVERAYGTQVAGLAFHHRSLNRNNLMYVSDILGMDLNSHLTLDEQIAGSNALASIDDADAADAPLFRRLATALSPSPETTDPLVKSMLSSRMLAGVSGWALERAWISQEIARRGAEGDPAFVGFGKPAPEFSLLDMGGILKLDQPNVRDFIDPKYFLAIAIFALAGSVLARVLDGKDRGQFWRMQTLGLRLIAWPLLLMAGGNLALDYGLHNLTTSSVDLFVILYSAMWWLVPARLAAISLERFIWVPLELRAQRKIPNVIRMISGLIIYLFAIFGVVAFVLGQTITSLLATSGLMAMIIGLAIQANIANIFSGIVLNIERPFKVGDYIKLNTVMGQVIDITWRTIRIRHLEGQLVCLANAKVSEAEIHNFSDTDANFVRTQLFVDPRYDPRLISKLVKEALDSFDIFQNLASAYFGPNCQFKGVECTNGKWAARYRVKFYLMKGNDENNVIHEVWARIWQRFQQEGIDWSLPPQTVALERTDLVFQPQPSIPSLQPLSS
ncbi:branched-chain amino acid transport system substrate-binding protein [uncultured Gammaproteobacteria bacterium]